MKLLKTENEQTTTYNIATYQYDSLKKNSEVLEVINFLALMGYDFERVIVEKDHDHSDMAPDFETNDYNKLTDFIKTLPEEMITKIIMYFNSIDGKCYANIFPLVGKVTLSTPLKKNELEDSPKMR